MIHNHRAPTAASWLLAALLSAGLIGCGSDDDPVSGPPPAVAGASVVAVADAATLAWNAPGSIDVLANDTASSGALTLSAVGTGAHGTAAIVSGKLVYTPDAGYFGSDMVSYTATAADGGATGTADVAITVQAHLRLSGTVTDGPIAGAAVTVDVGGTIFSTIADANGNYALDVTAADPAAFVTVTAQGTGAQAGVKLVSLVGDVASLAAKAGQSGQAASGDVPALNATHLSTAQAVLAARARADGKMPSTAAELAAASAAIDADAMLRLATVIRLVADKGVALPTGVSDTLALAQDKARLDAFVQDQLTNNAAVFVATKSGVLADASSVGTLDFATNGLQTIAYTYGPMVTYRADGTATVVYTWIGRTEATWKEDHGTVTVSLNAPLTSSEYSADTDPVTMEQNLILVTYTGAVFRQVSGDSQRGVVSWTATGSAIYQDGSRKGQSVPNYGFDGTAYAAPFVDVAARRDILPAEVAAGARLAGVSMDATGVYFNRRDIFRIVDGTTGVFESSGETATWVLADRWLTITGASGPRVRFARLAVNEGNAEEQWLQVAESVDGDAMVGSVIAAFADPAVRFDAASAARIWRFESFYDQDPSQVIQMKLYADGTGYLDFGAGNGGRPTTWSVDTDGRLVIKEFSNGSFSAQRTWTPLKARNGQYQAFVRRQNVDYYTGEVSSFSTYSIQRYADLGPAVKP